MNEDFFFFDNDDDKLSLEDRLRLVVKVAAWYLLALFAVLTICSLVGCKATERIVTVEKVRIDTLRENHTTLDSIYLRDSIYVHEWTKGDTVYQEKVRWKNIIHDHYVTDTMYISRTDSIPKPYPVHVEVEKHLSSWQQFVMWAGRLTLIALALAVGYKVYRIFRQKKL